MKSFLGESRHYLCAVAPYVSMGVRVELPWEKERGYQAWNAVIEARKLLQYRFRTDANGAYEVDFKRKRSGQLELFCYESGNLEEHMLLLRRQPVEIEDGILLAGYVRVYRDSFEFAVNVNHFVMDGTALLSLIKDFVSVYRDEETIEACDYIDDLQDMFRAQNIKLTDEEAGCVQALNEKWEERFPTFSVSPEQRKEMTEKENETAPFVFSREVLLKGEAFEYFHKKTKGKGLTVGDMLVTATMKAFPKKGYQIAMDARRTLGIDERTIGTVATGLYIPGNLSADEVHNRIREEMKSPLSLLVKNCSLNGHIFDSSYLAAIGAFRDRILFDFKECLKTNIIDFAVVSNMRAATFGEGVSEAWFLPYRMAKNSIAIGFITTANVLSITVGYSSNRYTKAEIEEAVEIMRNVLEK